MADQSDGEELSRTFTVQTSRDGKNWSSLREPAYAVLDDAKGTASKLRERYHNTEQQVRILETVRRVVG